MKTELNWLRTNFAGCCWKFPFAICLFGVLNRRSFCNLVTEARICADAVCCALLEFMRLLPAESMHVNMTVNCFGRRLHGAKKKPKDRKRERASDEHSTPNKNVRNLSIHLSTSDLNPIRFNWTRKKVTSRKTEYHPQSEHESI